MSDKYLLLLQYSQRTTIMQYDNKKRCMMTRLLSERSRIPQHLVMMERMVLSVSYIPSLPSTATFRMVFSTPLVTMPSPE